MRTVDVLEFLFNREGGRAVFGVDIPWPDARSVEFLCGHTFVRVLGVQGSTVEITALGRAAMALVVEGREVLSEPSEETEAPIRLAQPQRLEITLAKVNQEHVADLAEVYGIPESAVINLAVSELYDAKMINYRDAVEED